MRVRPPIRHAPASTTIVRDRDVLHNAKQEASRKTCLSRLNLHSKGLLSKRGWINWSHLGEEFQLTATRGLNEEAKDDSFKVSPVLDRVRVQ